jgi:hypothetical protein
MTGLSGQYLFFKDHLQRISDRLKQAEGTSAIRAYAPLESRDDAPFDQCHIRERGEQRHNGDDTLHDRAD